MFIPSLYDVQTIHVSTSAVFTNTAPTSVYRGAGRPEAIYLIERLVERAARVTGIDRVELRRRNLIKPEALPYHTPTHHNYDSGEFEKLMDQCLTLADWDGFRGAPQGQRAARQAARPRGHALHRARRRLQRAHGDPLRSGRHGHDHCRHAFARTGARDRVRAARRRMARRAVRGDQLHPGRHREGGVRPRHLSRRAARWSAATACASPPTRSSPAAKQMAGALMEAAPGDIEFRAGTFTVMGTDKRMSIGDVARAFFAPAGPVLKLGLGLDGVGTWSGVPGGAPNYPNGCQVCEVEVDPETGAVRIDRFVAVDDLGMVINPMICEGQIHGGIAQGVGQALFENVVYDRQSGQLITGSFLDYGMPRADDFPAFVSELVEIPAKTNPLGIKGIGEAGTIAAPPTVVNAVLDALRELGVEHLDMPLTPARIWQAANSAASASRARRRRVAQHSRSPGA